MMCPNVPRMRPYAPGKYKCNCIDGQREREREMSKPPRFTIMPHDQLNTQFGKSNTVCTNFILLLLIDLKTQGTIIMSLLLN